MQHLKWNHLIIIQEQLELFLTDIKIFECERIWNVPADGTELSSVLDDSVEEGETEKEHLVFSRLVAIVQDLVVKDIIGSQQV